MIPGSGKRSVPYWLGETYPNGTPGTTGRIRATVMFFCSDGADYVTEKNLFVVAEQPTLGCGFDKNSTMGVMV